MHSRRANRWNDSDDIFTIVRYLRKRHGIRMFQIKQECTVEFADHGCRICGEHMPLRAITRLARTRLIHTPDIVVTDRGGEIGLIIELDGKIHETEDVAARDQRRNEHYANFGIPFIVISSSRLKRERKNAFTYLDEEIERIGWPDRAASLQSD